MVLPEDRAALGNPRKRFVIDCWISYLLSSYCLLKLSTCAVSTICRSRYFCINKLLLQSIPFSLFLFDPLLQICKTMYWKPNSIRDILPWERYLRNEMAVFLHNRTIWQKNPGKQENFTWSDEGARYLKKPQNNTFSIYESLFNIFFLYKPKALKFNEQLKTLHHKKYI
jgi:hypothetical protein